MGVLRALHPRAGDLATTWDVNDPATVDAAVQEFERQMSERGRRAFADPGDGGELRLITEFLPGAKEIVTFRAFKAG
jgi:hypothetical protein